MAPNFFNPVSIFSSPSFTTTSRLSDFTLEQIEPIHMGFVSKNCISHIIIMRNLHAVKKDHIFKLCRVSYHAVLSYNGISPDKRAVTNLCILTDDRRPVNAGSRSDLCRFCNPDIALRYSYSSGSSVLPSFRIKSLISGSTSQGYVFPSKSSPSHCFLQIKKLLNGKIFHHNSFPPRFEATGFL